MQVVQVEDWKDTYVSPRKLFQLSVQSVNKTLWMLRTRTTEGQDSVFCEGNCNVWLHRHCVGLTKSAFNHIQVPVLF